MPLTGTTTRLFSFVEEEILSRLAGKSSRRKNGPPVYADRPLVTMESLLSRDRIDVGNASRVSVSVRLSFSDGHRIDDAL